MTANEHLTGIKAGLKLIAEGVKAAKVQFGLELGVVEQSFSVEGR